MRKKVGLLFTMSMFLIPTVFAGSYTMINNADTNVQIHMTFCGNADPCIVKIPAGGHKTATTPFGYIKGFAFTIKPADETFKGKECSMSKDKDDIVLRVRSSKLSLSGKTLTCDIE
ncbi:MAG: hypothetical protein Q8S31_05545 [Alphaproteobacteria bacterium]|nr:hypothetical protein [Alphaproteobacteria bacterium]